VEGFTIIDGVVAVVIILSALLAYSRGFVRETLSIAGWVAAAVLAFMFAGQAEPLVREIPILAISSRTVASWPESPPLPPSLRWA